MQKCLCLWKTFKFSQHSRCFQQTTQRSSFTEARILTLLVPDTAHTCNRGHEQQERNREWKRHTTRNLNHLLGVSSSPSSSLSLCYPCLEASVSFPPCVLSALIFALLLILLLSRLNVSGYFLFFLCIPF